MILSSEETRSREGGSKLIQGAADQPNWALPSSGGSVTPPPTSLFLF